MTEKINMNATIKKQIGGKDENKFTHSLSRQEYFVDKNSIVREIWGDSDTILLIFAGAAAEFALSKAVDWLYFTGRLPADPIGRLFSTVSYAREIVFSEKKSATSTIDAITAIHKNVEEKRGESIPEWAYRDILFMLIDYSIRSFELLERKLNSAEKQEILNVFNRVGRRMEIKGLSETFEEFEMMRQEYRHRNLQHSPYTDDLFSQYRKCLGPVRYRILLEAQILVVPQSVREMLELRRISLLSPMIRLYKMSRTMNIDWLLKSLLLPSKYKNEINALDTVPNQ